MHEGAHRLSLHAWLGYSWYDHRLSWKAEDYGGAEMMTLSSRDVWLPDFSVYNAGDAEATLLTSRFRVIVYPDGKVLHVPSLDLHYSCVADLTYWPHDTHNCTLKIGSWVHSGRHIDISVQKNFSTEVDDEVTKSPDGQMDTMEWKILDVNLKRLSKFYDCCTEPYVSLMVNIIVQREAPAFCWIIKTPAVCLVLLTVVLFILPPGAGEKIVFGGMNIILNLMFLIFAHGTVRNAPSHTPLLVQLISFQLVLAVISTMVAAVLVRAARGPYTTPPSPGLHRLALTLAPTFCLSAYVKQASGQGRLGPGTPKSDEVEIGSEADGTRSGEQGVMAGQWLLLGAVLDRLSLAVYLCISIIMLIRSSSVL
uniref:Uncharacterized protein n=1 Tax=Scylla olivacea TaxID=85551 RepID=A0A0P4W8G7_SCYOL